MNTQDKKVAIIGTILIYAATFVYTEESLLNLNSGKVEECVIDHKIAEMKEIKHLNEVQMEAKKNKHIEYVSIQGYTYKCDKCDYIGVSI